MLGKEIIVALGIFFPSFYFVPTSKKQMWVWVRDVEEIKVSYVWKIRYFGMD